MSLVLLLFTDTASLPESRDKLKYIPRMNQVQFIQLCKTLYDLFTESPEEQQLYHSIATVATLLLKIGDVGKRFYLRQAGLPSLGSFDDSSSLDLSPQHGPSHQEAGAGASQTAASHSDAGASQAEAGASHREADAGQTRAGASQEATGASPSEGSSAEPDSPEQSSATQAPKLTENNKSGLDTGNVNKTDNTDAPKTANTEGEASCDTTALENTGKTESGSGEEANDKTSPSKGSRSPSHLPDSDWSITFEQFLASVLTESALVSYFERQVDIQSAIQKYRNRRLIERQSSLMGTPPKE